MEAVLGGALVRAFGGVRGRVVFGGRGVWIGAKWGGAFGNVRGGLVALGSL
jgi:hypothetical protein